MLVASFLGGGSGTSATLVATSYTASADQPSAAVCDFTLGSDGLVAIVADSGSAYAWLLSGNAADCQVTVTVTAGTFTSGTTGSAVNLSTSPKWRVQRATVGSKACTATFTITLVSTGAVLATASITMTASVI